MKTVYDLIRYRATLEVICGNCDNSRVFNHRFLVAQFGAKHYLAALTKPCAGNAARSSRIGSIVRPRRFHAAAATRLRRRSPAPRSMLAPAQAGSTSRTYEPPRTYTRREVNAHNAKYAARKKKERKPAAPKEPAPDYDGGPDPFAC